MIKLAICISHTQSHALADFAFSYGYVIKEAGELKAKGLIADYSMWRGLLFPTDANRNAIVKEVLKSDATHFMWLDSDHVFPIGMLNRLLSHGKDMTGGVYFKKAYPFQSVSLVAKEQKFFKGKYTIYNPAVIKEKSNMIFKADATGMGCTLIKREVFEKLPHPWFEYRWSEQSEEKTISEEMKFFEDAKKAGFELWIDEYVICPHIHPVAYDIKDHLFGCEEFEKERMERVLSNEIQMLLKPDYRESEE